MIEKAYHANFQHNGIAPVIKLDEQFHILELFHGPTASFKDLALQLTPRFFQEAISSSTTQNDVTQGYLVLVATSGDTGSAVLEGFANVSRTKVSVLYPNDGVSSIQKRQMVTTNNPNVNVLGVQGDFDFCQSSIKEIFNDVSFCKRLKDLFNVKLTAANSINWGRLVPQVVYHASSYLELVKNGVIAMGEKADVCIPTGNFGNILAAYYAKVRLEYYVQKTFEILLRNGAGEMHPFPLRNDVVPLACPTLQILHSFIGCNNIPLEINSSLL
jgi:threonine synthase